MTDRARLVYALLRTLLAWTPTPRSRMGLDRVPRGFAGGALRYVTCPDCLTNDRVLPGCETCGGRGEIADPGPDPYETKNTTRFGGVAGERQADAQRRLDQEIERMAQQLERPQKRTDERVHDPLTTAITVRDRLYASGSYAELEHALHRLRLHDEGWYHLAMTVCYQPFREPPIEPLRPAIVAVCELLAVWIDGPIRVPAEVTISTDAEVERVAREGRGALWRGRGDWHRMRRSERDALIVAMAADGRSPRVIGLRFNLTSKRVKQIIADHSAADSTATGPAA